MALWRTEESKKTNPVHVPEPIKVLKVCMLYILVGNFIAIGVKH